MDDRFLTITVKAAVVIVAAIVATDVSRAPAKPGRADEPGAAAPLVLAQYNGCPNGRCR